MLVAFVYLFTFLKQFMQHDSIMVVVCSESSAFMGRKSAGLFSILMAIDGDAFEEESKSAQYTLHVSI